MGMGNYKERDEVLSAAFDISKITCSFLIPELLYKKLTFEDKKRIGKNLEYLLKKYKNKILKSKRIHKKTATSLYQEKGGGLIKFNVRIQPIFWEELTILSRSHGVSNCYLYHLILKWEILDQNGTAPVQRLFHSRINERLILVWMIDFRKEFSQRVAQLLNEFPPDSFK